MTCHSIMFIFIRPKNDLLVLGSEQWVGNAILYSKLIVKILKPY